MMHEYDNITLIERGEDMVFRLPDGLSVEVPQATIRRSAVLQEAIHTSDASGVPIYLPRGVLQDWLQSVEALKAAATSTGHGTDIASNPRLLQLLRVRCIWLFAVRDSSFVCRTVDGSIPFLSAAAKVERDIVGRCLPCVACLCGARMNCFVALEHHSADAVAADSAC